MITDDEAKELQDYHFNCGDVVEVNVYGAIYRYQIYNITNGTRGLIFKLKPCYKGETVYCNQQHMKLYLH